MVLIAKRMWLLRTEYVARIDPLVGPYAHAFIKTSDQSWYGYLAHVCIPCLYHLPHLSKAILERWRFLICVSQSLTYFLKSLPACNIVGRNGAPSSLLGGFADQNSLLFIFPGEFFAIRSHMPIHQRNSPKVVFWSNCLFVLARITSSRNTEGKRVRNMMVQVTNFNDNPLGIFIAGPLIAQ